MNSSNYNFPFLYFSIKAGDKLRIKWVFDDNNGANFFNSP